MKNYVMNENGVWSLQRRLELCKRQNYESVIETEGRATIGVTPILPIKFRAKHPLKEILLQETVNMSDPRLGRFPGTTDRPAILERIFPPLEMKFPITNADAPTARGLRSALDVFVRLDERRPRPSRQRKDSIRFEPWP